MYVETWLHFREFLESIFTGLSNADQKYAALLFPLIEDNKNKNSGVRQAGIDNVIVWLNDNVLPQVSGEAGTDVSLSITFLRQINVGREARHCKTVEGCRFWDNYWYGGVCNEEQKEEPIPEPDDPKCSDHKDRGSCLKAGCFWGGRSCVSTIPDVLEEILEWDIHHTRLDVSNQAVTDQMGYMKALMEFFIHEMGVDPVFAQEAAVYQLLGVQVEASTDSAFASIDHIVDRIGAIEKLEGKTVVDAILSVEGGEETAAMALVEKLLRDLDYQYSAVGDYITRQGDGIIFKTQLVVDALVKDGNVVTIPTIENVEQRLNQAYSDVNDNAMIFLRHLDTSYSQVKGVQDDTGMTLRQIVQQMIISVSSIIDVVSGEITRLPFDLAETAFDWLPASFGWVKQKLIAVGNIIFDCIEDVTMRLADQINEVGTIVTQMPDWWIERLKEKLGI